MELFEFTTLGFLYQCIRNSEKKSFRRQPDLISPMQSGEMFLGNNLFQSSVAYTLKLFDLLIKNKDNFKIMTKKSIVLGLKRT